MVDEMIPEVRQTNKEIQNAAVTIGRAAEGVDNFLRPNQDRLVKAIDNFVEVASRTADIMNVENRQNLQTALRNVSNASQRLDGLVKETETLIKESQKTVQTTTDRIDSVGRNADGFITETRQAVKSVGDQLTSATKNADAFFTEARTAVKSVSDRIDSVGKNTEEFLTEAKQSAKVITDRVDATGKNADQLITETRQTIKIVGERVDSAGRNADELMKEGRVTVQRLNETLARSDEVIANLQTATRPLAERAPVVMKNLEDSSLRINQITYNIAEFSKALNQGDGTLRRLIVDPALYNSLNDTVMGINRSVTRFDCLVRDLEVFADKIARHPELLGVSGAVSGSAGLKR
jgi:phospholipid/cholesterol/gamma-HCH transport system substrate-binding protein